AAARQPAGLQGRRAQRHRDDADRARLLRRAARTHRRVLRGARAGRGERHRERVMKRRAFLGYGAALGYGTGLGALARAGTLAGASVGVAHAATASPQVLVVGGGYGGAAAARYVRLWGGGRIGVTLVEPNERFV